MPTGLSALRTAGFSRGEGVGQMANVSNRGCIRRLAGRSLRASMARNLIAVLAIALTTMLFTSLFSITASMNASFQENNFRQAGGYFHGSYKEVTADQVAELTQDERIRSYGLRHFLGLASGDPFAKVQAEVSYMDESCAQASYCVPETGALPEEGTMELATDTRVLALLGVEPALGAEVTLTFQLGFATSAPVEVTDTFVLSGWWEYDGAASVSMIQVADSYCEQVLSAYTSADPEHDDTGHWDLNIFLPSVWNIRGQMVQILSDHGYQCEDTGADNYIGLGVNWGYTSSQLTENLDLAGLLGSAALVLIFALTGYLIIYNVFQISVAGDIRFYGLLKTIGTTGRQLKRIIRYQALALSAIGIPIGLLLGWVAGNVLAPLLLRSTSGGRVTNSTASAHPLIFLGAALFSLLTVFLSCRRPGRMAARVSPMEAVRYTEGASDRRKRRHTRRGKNGASLQRMAWSNLGRSRAKTVLTVLSLCLAVTLLSCTYTFVSGFDMDRFLQRYIAADFIVADADYFRSDFRTEDEILSQEVVDSVQAEGGITQSGKVYGLTSAANYFVPEEWYRAYWEGILDEEALEQAVAQSDHDETGQIAHEINLYGMDSFPLSLLNVLEGDLAPLSDPDANAIAAVYYDDDYGNLQMDSNWTEVGDEVTVRYIDDYDFIDMRTGEPVTNATPMEYYQMRALEYRDVTYTVCAAVTVPQSISFRYYGGDQYILGSEAFIRDTGTESVMNFTFNVEDDARERMESFLSDYTETVQTGYSYESEEFYREQFGGLRDTFLLVGTALSGIVGLVGALNFLNAILTGMISRRREFAVLQSIGMTRRQLQQMLVCEGLFYALTALAAGFVLSFAAGPLLSTVLRAMFWFFSYRFSPLPFFILLPVFLLLGAGIPLLVYRHAGRASIVEQLRASET